MAQVQSSSQGVTDWALPLQHAEKLFTWSPELIVWVGRTTEGIEVFAAETSGDPLFDDSLEGLCALLGI